MSDVRMSVEKVFGKYGTWCVGQGSRHTAGRTRAGWVVYRNDGDWGPSLNDSVFDTRSEALAYARERAGA